MGAIPQNLVLLHRGEEVQRGKALEFIEADEALQAHVSIVEKAMDLLDVYVRRQKEDSDDGRAIQHLAIRVFNGFATAWKLMASGYFQAAAMIQRDVFETLQLVNYFYHFPEKVAVWRSADRKQLLNEFGPSRVRKALDNVAGQGKSHREAIYQKFSMLAAHPSRVGFDMLRPKGGNGSVIGPFMEVASLRALLEEHGMLAVQAGFAFNTFLDSEIEVAQPVVHAFAVSAMRYGVRYLGINYTEEQIAEADRLFGPEGA